MKLRRAVKIVLARWPVIVLAGLVGAVVALGLATQYNQSIDPRFEAKASVAFIQLDRETDAAFKARLESARSIALSVTSDADAGVLEVETDSDAGVVSFVVNAETDDLARILSTGFRDEYLAAEPSSSILEQITGRLDSLRVEVAELQSQLVAEDALPPDEPDVQALRGLLAAKLSELRQEFASLSLQLAVPELAEIDAETLSLQLDATQQLISDLERELTELPSPPVTIGSDIETPSDLDVLVLQRRLSDLQSQYIDLSLRLIDLSGSGDLNEDVSVIDRTPADVGRRTAGVVGAAAGFLASIAILLLLDTARRPIREADDVTVVRSLGMVEPAGSRERSRLPWYERATSTERRTQIQGVRSSLNGAIVPGSSLGISPVHATVDDVRLLAADLAASVAATGREVLLIDATFSAGLPIAEYGDGGVTLTDLIEVEAMDRRSDLAGLAEVMKGLRGLRPGSGGGDPADLVAGRGFGDVLEDAAGLGFAAIVAMPKPGSAVSEELTQRLDRVLLVGRSGRTLEREIASVVGELSSRRADPAGAILLTGSERLKARSVRIESNEKPKKSKDSDSNRSKGKHLPGASIGDPGDSSGEATPASGMESSSPKATTAHGTVATLPVTAVEVDDSMTLHVDDEELPEMAERFLAAAVAALVAADGGLQGVSPALVESEGMVPITQGLGSLTVAERLVRLLPDKLDSLPEPLLDAVTDVIGCRVGVNPTVECRDRLDAWVRDRFHSVSNGKVLHLSSPDGAVELLVKESSLSIDRLQLLRARDLQGLRQRMRRLSASAGHPVAAVNELADVMGFDLALRSLVAEAESANGAFDWRQRLTDAGLLVGHNLK